MLYLITYWDDDFNQRIAFLVRAPSRQHAKRLVARYCVDNHLFEGADSVPPMRSHLLVIDNEHLLQRIDHLVV